MRNEETVKVMSDSVSFQLAFNDDWCTEICLRERLEFLIELELTTLF